MNHLVKRSGRGSRLRLVLLAATAAAFLLVPAANAAAENMVKINVTGSGSGEIYGNSEFGGGPFQGTPPVACSYESPGPATGVCEAEMASMAPLGLSGFVGVGLLQEAGLGSAFAGWTINEGFAFSPCGPTSVECFMGAEEEEDAEVTVTFNAAIPLTVNKEEGEGTIVSNPAGINCGGTCSAGFNEGESVTLTASPAVGYAFKGWKKCDSGGVNGRKCTVTMSAAKEVGAKFVPVHNLTVSKAGGSGTLKSKPGGISCVANCPQTTAAFGTSSTVEVTETPSKHFHFVEWGGDCSGSGSCSVAMSADHSVSALFEEDEKFALSITKQGGGTGSIKTKPAGIVCSYTCSAATASFYKGEEVEVSVTPGKGSSLNWSNVAGTCTGSTNPCKVTMSGLRSLVASFE